MAKDTANEVAVVKANAVALANLHAEDAGSGFEEASVNAFAIPFLQILQSGSPQCKKSDGAYIKGAEEGKLYNTVTQDLFDGDTGVTVVPVHYTQRFIEWRPRESGGGFVKEHLPGQQPVTQKDDKGRDVIPSSGNTLVDTRNHYVLIKLADGTCTPALLSMTSTQQRKSKQWMSKMQGIKIKVGEVFQTAPMFSREYRITTIPESNDKGSWFGFRIELVGIVDDAAVYAEAKSFREAVRSGVAKAQQDTGADISETAEAF